VHDHHTHGSRHKGRLRVVFGLTAGFLVAELAVALWAGSLSLLADAVHMAIDAGSLLLSLGAIWFAERPPTAEKTYGYYRVEILAALANGVVLCVVALGILWKAWERFWAPPEVPGLPLILTASAALAINLVGLALLHAGAGESLNVRAAYLEVLGDALASGAVIVAGAVILVTGFHLADPLAAGAIGLLILPRTAVLLSHAVNVLLEGVPPHLDIREIQRAMLAAEGVRHVHDLHVWTLTSGREAMSAHAVVEAGAPADRILGELHRILHARFGIDHTTIQIETEPAPLVQIAPAGQPDP
jgi:cobalt-zinc-cadmium efflux system protein